MAQEIYLKLDGIDGESKKSGVENWIEVFSFSNGATNHALAAHGTGSGTGKVELSSISLTKILDKASVKLFLNSANGKHIATGKIIVRESTGDKTTKTYFQYDLKQVFIDSVSWGAAAGGGKPSENVSLSFAEIVISYYPQNADGSLGGVIKGGWNVEKNQQV